MKSFSFESYGVRVAIDCPTKGPLEQAESVVRRSLLNRITLIDRADAEHVFVIKRVKGELYLHLNRKYISHGPSEWGYFKFFDTMVRLTIAEFAVDHVFIHCGVVVWKGKAIMFPADSFRGKTTVVAEFVRRGAIYYSDEYAVIDAKGLIHPFERPLAIRDNADGFRQIATPAESLGGTIGVEPVPASLVVFTQFQKYARWRPERLTPGVGLMKIIPYAISLRFNPEFTLFVLKQLTNRAILVQSQRGESRTSVNKMISFVDKLFF